MKPQKGEDPESPMVVYCDGVFDMLHIGHIKVFEQCKNFFKYTKVIVGISGDVDCSKHKRPPIMSQNERAEAALATKFVDDVICPCPWIPTVAFLKEHKIDYICHDPIPYKVGDIEDCYAEIKAAGMFLPTKRTEGVSTTDIMLKILRNAKNFQQQFKEEIDTVQVHSKQETPTSQCKSTDQINAYCLKLFMCQFQ